MERCPSGRRCTIGSRVWSKAIGGSNPPLSDIVIMAQKRSWFRILVVPTTIIAFVLYIYFTEGWSAILRVFRTLDYKWAACAFGVYTLALLLEQSSIAIMRHHYQKRFSFLYVIHSSLLAQFYEILTPGTFAFGPITQVNCMNKQGLPPSKGVAVMLVQQSCAMISLSVFAVLCILLNIEFFISKMVPILWVFFTIAILINFGTVFVYMFVPRCDGVFIRLLNGIINLLYKVKVIRHAQRRDELCLKSKDQIIKLKTNMMSLDYSPFEWISGIVLMLIYRAAVYSVQYFSALAFGVDVNGKFLIFLAAQSIINNIASATPIPGGLGITELAYVLVMVPVIGNSSTTNFMMLFSRIVTYYYPLLLGACMLSTKTPIWKRKLKTASFIVRRKNRESDS